VSAPDFAAFVVAEQPRLVRACHLLLDDHAVAEEVAQEALLRAASRWEHVRILESPGGWTHRVALNLATSQLRRWRVELRVRRHVATASERHRPEHDHDDALAVREALQRLPAAQRRLLVLRHVLQWRATEIAALDEVAAATVRQRLTRARTALRDELTAVGMGVDAWDDVYEEATDVH
jgi:RNA polymerase sigma-70 factor, ECF subfamily